jgi:hypothetical protein
LLMTTSKSQRCCLGFPSASGRCQIDYCSNSQNPNPDRQRGVDAEWNLVKCVS